MADVDLSLGRGAARVHILKGISLAVARGETVGLTGPSGSGKSTLLMAMAGLERADSGRIAIEGTDIGKLGEDALARFRGQRIGIVFQSFPPDPHHDGAGERRGAARARRPSATPSRARGTSWRPSASPSGPRIIQPSSPAASSSAWRWPAPSPRARRSSSPMSRPGNLDEATGSQIVDLMLALKRDRGTTLVLVTHDLSLAARCDRTIRLRSGSIEPDAPARLAAHAREAELSPSRASLSGIRRRCRTPAHLLSIGRRRGALSPAIHRLAFDTSSSS